MAASRPNIPPSVEMNELPSPTAALAPSAQTTTTTPFPIHQGSISIQQSTPAPSAIGQATDAPIEPVTNDPTAVNIVLIIPATGKRHTYKIDKSYLDRRQVTVEEGDPFNLTVYGMKELILRDWKDEWVPKPQAPTFIRLILMGRELDDKASLKESRILEGSPNVVHMMARHIDPVDDDEGTGKGKDARRDSQSANRGGCCCIIL